MTGEEFAQALLGALERRKKRRIQRTWGEEVFEELIRDALDPQPFFEEDLTAPTPLPVTPSEFPRLLVSYGQKTLEYIVINNSADWAAYHDWYTVFPPQQPTSRFITTTLEAEVEKLKAAGVPERPREEWQRRKLKGAA